MNAAANRVSVRLQDIAQTLDEILEEIAGERVTFVLTLQVGEIAQYVSNAARADGETLIRSLLERWAMRRADIPAHYNPDLRTPPNGAAQG